MKKISAILGTLLTCFSPQLFADLNRIYLFSSDQDQINVATKSTPVQKYIFKDPVQVQFSTQNGTFKTNLKTRGQSCLYATRKCYSLSLQEQPHSNKKPQIQLHGPTRLSGHSFNLVSMWQDRGYLSTQIGFEFFRSLGLFDVKTEYAVLTLNQKPQGLYLITDKPKNAIDRITSQAIVARRGYGARIEVTDVPKKSTPQDKKSFEKAFHEMYADLKIYEGEELKSRLEQKMNLKQYMQWLVVNSILENGDYSDEVYFYSEIKKPIYFQIMPWDFDDLFAKPHSSKANNETYKDRFESQILYSYENPLDVAIGNDPVLYAMLEQTALELLVNVNNPFIDTTLQKVYQNLSPYLNLDEVLQGGALDRNKKAYTVSQIESVLNQRNQQIKKRIQKIIKMITQK